MSEEIITSIIANVFATIPLLITAYVTIKKLNYTTQVSEKAVVVGQLAANNADRAYTEANGLNNKIATLTHRFTTTDAKDFSDKETSDGRITELEKSNTTNTEAGVEILDRVDKTTKATDKTTKATLKEVKKIAEG